MNWKVFFTRTGSAIIYAAVMLTGLILHDPIAIILLALLIQFLCLKEFLTIAEKIFPNSHFSKFFRGATQVLGALMLLGLMLFQTSFVLILLPIPLIVLLPAILTKKTRLKEAFIALVGLLYICLPMTALITLRNLHYAIPLALVIMIWANDTMAYITGSFIGKTPFSAISPKKTWEGTIGGVIFTLIGTFIWIRFSNIAAFPAYVWIGLALIATIAGTAGDLLESKLKRIAGVKDSGNILPGHGGALDRFDSLLVALPFALCFISLITG